MRKKITPYKFFLNLFGRIDKRRRFVIGTFFLAFLVLISSFLTFNKVKYFVFFIAFSVYFTTFFSILEGISRIEWLMLFVLPVYFTVSFIFFYFLLPVRWLTRLPFVSLFTISIYAILLSSNIFNVGVEKSLQLFRAAFSVNFLFLTITAFLTFSLLLSFRLSFFFNFLLSLILIFPLSYQFLWTIDPKEKFSKELFKYSGLISLLIAEIALVFSFVPIRPNIFALLLTATFYSLSGLFQAFLEDRLFKSVIREYLIVFIVVLLIALVSINW